jgi:hypothetical protein
MSFKNKFFIVSIFTLLILFNIKGESKGVDIIMNAFVPKSYYFGGAKYFFEDEQPIRLEVSLLPDRSKKYDEIGRDDWYNLLEFSIQPMRHKYIADENGNKVFIEEIGKSGLDFVYEEKKKLNYKIIEKEDLVRGKIRPDEVKSIVIEALDDGDKPFKPDYTYKFFVSMTTVNGVRKGDTATHKVKKLISHKQKMDWHRRRAKDAEKKGDKLTEIEHYKEVIELETNLVSKRNFSMKVSDYYQETGDYSNAKKYIIKAQKAIDKSIMIKKEGYEKAVKAGIYKKSFEEFDKESTKRPLIKIKENSQKKLKELDELIKKQDK